MKFRNPEHALRWAYETSNSPIVKISSIHAMRGADRGEGGLSKDELTPYDFHAQAALILSLCSSVLSPLHMAYVSIQFGREAAGFNLLGRQLAANFGTGMHSRKGIEHVIRAYCGEKIGLRELRKTMSCGMLKAASFRNRGYDMLDAIHAQALNILRSEMESKGLVRCEDAREIA